MKLLVLILVLTFAVQAHAGSVTVSGVTRTTLTADDLAMTAQKDRHNKAVCKRKGLPATCTQAQFNAAASGPSGPGVIYEGAQATQNYALDRIMEMVAAFLEETAETDRINAIAAWKAATPAQRSAACINMGKTAACE